MVTRARAKGQKEEKEERERVDSHRDLSVANVTTAMKLVIMHEIALILEGNKSVLLNQCNNRGMEDIHRSPCA